MCYLLGHHTYDGIEHKHYVLSESVRVGDSDDIKYIRHPTEDAYGIYVNDQLVGVARPVGLPILRVLGN